MSGSWPGSEGGGCVQGGGIARAKALGQRRVGPGRSRREGAPRGLWHWPSEVVWTRAVGEEVVNVGPAQKWAAVGWGGVQALRLVDGVCFLSEKEQGWG